MKTTTVNILVATSGVLAVVAALWWMGAQIASFEAATKGNQTSTVPPEVRYKTKPPQLNARPFTRDQVLQFMAAAHDAEDIKDPLQRCLAFPDPPGSHWNHASVVAYCKYRNQPSITFAQAKQLIESGHAAKLDQMLAQALHEQLTNPDALGRFDRIYLTDFENGSFDIRPILDAWKRQSPDSAFAYAASGMAYEKEAFKARGGKWSTETPVSNFESMDRLVMLAHADLLRAVKLDPKMVPAYAAMISLGGAALGRRYALAAVRRGLAVAPGDFMLYDRLLWLDEPKWTGSMPAMKAVVDEIRAKQQKYPLLALNLHKVDEYRINNCECSSQQTRGSIDGVVEGVTGYGDLDDAGDAAWDAGDREGQAVYYSEVLRFKPGYPVDRIRRMYALMYFHYLEWAKAEGDRILAASPDNSYALKARGIAYMNLSDIAHAKQDFAAAVKINPKDDASAWYLGVADADTGEWDKAWKISNQLIDQYPKYAEGWLLRAHVQIGQPRAGLDKTFQYLDAHFGGNAEVSLEIAKLRTWKKWVDAHPQEQKHAAVHELHAHAG